MIDSGNERGDVEPCSLSANYIKSPYCEENADNSKFGLIIASEGPTAQTEQGFWKMIVT